MLLERGAETIALEELIGAGRQGTAGIALLEGEPGIGKTSLLRTAEAQGRAQGVQVLTARCAPLERDFAFGAARQLLEPSLAAASPDVRANLLAGSATLAEPLFTGSGLTGEAAAGGNGTTWATHGLYQLTANLAAHGPLLLSVDDLHWIDAPSLRWLAHLARRLEGLPIVLVMAARAGEPPVDARLVADLRGSPACRVLRPRALSGTAVAEMVRAVLGEDAAEDFCRACGSATGGNPFLLQELLAALRDGGVAPTAAAAASVTDFGPQAVSRHVLARLGGQSPAAARLARAVAVLGDGADLQVSAAMAGLDAATAAATAADLERIGVLRSADPPAFAHPVVRTAIYQEPPSGERTVWHQRAAGLLRERRAPVEQIAAHLLAIEPGGQPWAADLLRVAAQRALASGAPEVAATYLRRALREPLGPSDHARVTVDTGIAELHTDPKAAVGHLSEALAMIEDPRERARIALLLGHALSLANRSPEAVQVVQQALDGVRSVDDGWALRLQSELQYFALVNLETVPLAAEWLAQMGGRQPDTGTQAGRLLLAMQTLKAFGTGSRADSLELARAALATGGLPDAGDHWGVIFLVLMATLAYGDEQELGAQLLDGAIEEARRRGSMVILALALALRSNLHLLGGAVEPALTQAEAALDVVDLPHLGDTAALPVAHLVHAQLHRGRIEEAQALLEAAGFTGELPMIWPCNLMLGMRGRLRVAQGEPEGALRDFTEAGRRQLGWGLRNPSILAWRSDAALVLAAQGEQAEARRLAAEELELARRWGTPRSIGIALRALGVAEGGEQGLERLRSAVTTLERSSARLELCATLIDLGAHLRRSGQRRAAREVLRRASALAGRCGSTWLAERARTERLAAGGGTVATWGASLTPAERRVALLAAAGRTNRDIAAELFLAQRTVEVHLTHTYRKLGISGRSGLAAGLRAAGVEAG